MQYPSTRAIGATVAEGCEAVELGPGDQITSNGSTYTCPGKLVECYRFFNRKEFLAACRGVKLGI